MNHAERFEIVAVHIAAPNRVPIGLNLGVKLAFLENTLPEVDAPVRRQCHIETIKGAILCKERPAFSNTKLLRSTPNPLHDDVLQIHLTDLAVLQQSPIDPEGPRRAALDERVL